MLEKPGSETGEQDFDFVHLSRYFSELSPQPMVAVEGKTHIVRHINAAFSGLVGKERSELIGRPFARAVPEGEDNGCLALLDRVYRTGMPEILVEQEHSQRPPVYWSYSVWAILGKIDEDPVGVIIQVTDATEMAVFRRQVTAMNEQLLVSATRQHELTETAERANRLKDDFLATLSHELRAPLTSIVGWAELLGRGKLDMTTSLRAIEVIRRNVRLQVALVDDLLDISRIITGKLRLSVQPVDLAAIIIAAVDGLRAAAEAKEIRLELQLDSQDGQVSGDPERLQQVAWNLISNAVKFTPKGGRVFIRQERIGAHLEVKVSDTGVGIAPGFLPYVFDRFRQADSTITRSFGGLGLGLSIVRQLIELHGGTVRVESGGEGLGATFTISLPLTAVHSPAINTGVQQPEFHLSEQECPPELNGVHVLVVDDDPDMCELLHVILEDCGAKVKTASSAAAALEEVGREDFDVLISDIGMPDEDGYSLITKVHALARERGVKVPAAAALTAYVGEREQIRVLQSGFQVHLSKPISPNELLAVVANLAGRTK